jgi:hypothetical protein
VTTDPRVARLRSLDTEATPGPWRPMASGSIRGAGDELVMLTVPNRRLVAAMRNAWPATVTLLEGVLELHSVIHGGNECGKCWKPWPCRNAKDALAVLATLESPS